MIPNSGPMVPNGAVPRLIVLGASAVATSHTGDTNPSTLATIAVPANAMGANGMLRITAQWSFTNNANAKVTSISLGGTAFGSQSIASSASARSQTQIANRGASNSQVGPTPAQANFGGAAGAVTTAAIDTTQAQSITIGATLANAADTATLESYLVELMPG
jgi:hypothetical protein